MATRVSAESLLTIAICTYNRARLLDETLESFRRTFDAPQVPCEILVVDNNSRDQTRAVVDAWIRRSIFPIRYVFESIQGLSRARNRAIQESQGTWIWFADDDVRFSVNWLTHAIDGIQAFPDAAALTGRIAVAFEPAKPSWLPASLLPYYGLTSFGDERRWLTTTELPVGANTAFRKQVFDTVGPFREDLGRMARSLISCEESEMAMRLHRRQFRIGYVPGAVVQHRVSSNRATLAWLRRRAFWGGVSNVLVERGTLAASRRELMKQSSDIIRKVSKSAFNNGLGVEHQLEYVRQLGIARQLLVEATIQRRS